MRNILVVGLDSVALARSAKKSGLKVFAVDFFGDQDLKKTCESTLSIVVQKPGKSSGRLEKDFSPNKFLVLARRISKKHRVDGILLASGLEDSPKTLSELNKLAPIIGNPPRTIESVRNKVDFFHQIRKLGLNHPETIFAKTVEEAEQAAKDIGFPVVIKPFRSLGGAGIRLAEGRNQLEEIFRQFPPSTRGFLIQEHINGKHMSVSFISTGEKSVILTLNDQLLGNGNLGQKEPFGYCGNIVPASADEGVANECDNLVQRIALHFNLQGSNGVDLIIPEGGSPCLIEVNPRFQGTLECVERVLGINLVKAHLDACIKGVLPSLKKAPSSKVYVRLILYARHRSYAPNFTKFDEVRDIPVPEAIIEDGEPLCSIIVEGTLKSALEKAQSLARRIYMIVHPVTV